MPGPLMMLGIQAGLGAGQAYLASRQQKAAEEQQRRQAAQDKLIQSFNPGAQPTPVAQQQPGVAQQMLSDPITKQLIAGLISKGIGGLGNLGNSPPVVGQGGGGSVGGMNSPYNQMTR